MTKRAADIHYPPNSPENKTSLDCIAILPDKAI
jgi:hypothetical protein